MKTKKILSTLLVVCLLLALLPTAAFATGTGKAIRLVDKSGAAPAAGNIAGAQASNVYFGTYPQSSDGNGGYNDDPIKWRVLQNADGHLLLLSDQNLDAFRYNESYTSETWEASTLRARLNGTGDYVNDSFKGEAFTEMEFAAVADTEVVNAENPSYGTAGGNDTTDKVFLLSIAEARNTAYGFTDSYSSTDTRVSLNTDYAKDRGVYNSSNDTGGWWLRSPGFIDYFAAFVSDLGRVNYYGVNVGDADVGVRPAFNLNLNSVLFTSAAAGGKSSGAAGADALTEILDYPGTDWKLTLLDDARSFAVTETAATAAPGGSVTLNYTGATVYNATTAPNEYISAILADDSGNLLYYGRLAQPESADDALTVKLPAGLATGSYTLKLFSEQFNGDCMTDYASAFSDVALTVASVPEPPAAQGGPAIQLVTSGAAANIAGAQASNIYFGTYQQSADGQGGYNTDPIKWRVLQNADGHLLLLSDQNLDSVQYNTNYTSVTWETSTIRSWLNGYGRAVNQAGTDYSASPAASFLGTAFTTGEQAAIPAVTVVNDNNPKYGTAGGNNTTDKLFLLSIAEATTTGFGFTDNYVRKAGNTDYAKSRGIYTYSSTGCGDWWLRSPGYYGSDAAIVGDNGGVFNIGYGVHINAVGVRPAFNLNLNSVLFTSAAAGGKSSGAAGADALTEISDYTGSDWKLTLLDESRSDFTAFCDSASGDVWTIKYSGAKNGTNEYISALVVNSSGEVTYYGRLAEAQSGDDKTVTVDLEGKYNDGDTLYVFNEQYNGDYMTDYASAFINPTTKAIQLVTSGAAANIAGAQASNVYFGTYQQSDDGRGGYNTDPIKWRVLSNAGGKLLLLSDQNLDVVRYNENYTSVTWETSTIRSWLNGYGRAVNQAGTDYSASSAASFLGTAFTTSEQAAIPAVTVVNDNNPEYGTAGGNNTTDKLFLLSIAEATTTGFGFTDNYSGTDVRKAGNTDYAKSRGIYTYSRCGYWWLRSPGSYDYGAALGDVDGDVNGIGYTVDIFGVGVRPAFHINLNSVLFTSVAAGGKSSGDAGADALTEILDYPGTDWKLTLLDVSRSFAVTETAATAAPGGSVTLNYTGATVYNATTAPNEYISAILADDSGNLLYYGRLAQPESADDALTVKLPAGLATGSYTLKLFSEQFNGDCMTDYASAFSDVALTVTNTHSVTITAGTGMTKTAGSGATTQTGLTGAMIDVVYEADENYYFPTDYASVGTTTGVTVTWDSYTQITVSGTPTADTTINLAAATAKSITIKEIPVEQNTDGTYSFTMPAEAVTVTPAFVKEAEPVVPDEPGDVSDRFKDVSRDAWYHDAVQWAVDNGIMNGVSADKFYPGGSTTRAMVVTMLWRLDGKPNGNPSPFTDVPAGSWYEKAVNWAAETGVVKGTSETTFSPDVPITREQLAAILYRYAETKGQGFTGAWAFPLDFPDAADMSEYAYEAMCWMTMHGVINGMDDGTLAPRGDATRAQIATVFMWTCQEK